MLNIRGIKPLIGKKTYPEKMPISMSIKGNIIISKRHVIINPLRETGSDIMGLKSLVSPIDKALIIRIGKRSGPISIGSFSEAKEKEYRK